MSTAAAPNASPDARDKRVLDLYERLMEIERRLIATRLHVFGKPPASPERHDLLRMIASFDRPERGVRALTQLIAEGLGLDSYPEPMKESDGFDQQLHDRDRVDSLVADSIKLFTQQPGEIGARNAIACLAESGCAVSDGDVERVFEMLADVCAQLDANRELEALTRALRGNYIEPGPGADIVQNPAVLPTGRNTHAINPYSVPSPAAVIRARPLAAALLDRHRKESGKYPETIAMVLWGIDNIKSEGEAVAQALWLLGVKPLRDSLNRATDVEVIPLEQLGRPRIDVVMTVSGIFRDLFGTTMSLLDTAVRRVAALEEPDDQNYVRKHVRQQMKDASCSLDEAVVRVFSNAPGNYGTNVNFMVSDSQWEESGELGDLFVTRKCFAYGRDSRGRTFDGRESKKLLERALERVEVTYQSIDSIEVGIVDIDHYFEYLGGVTRAVEKRSGSRPAVYLSDTLSAEGKVRTLEETVQLETRTKTLNPKWFEGMLEHGFSGVAEIEHRITNTFGWSATADAVEDWVYDEVAATFVLDYQMLDRLRALNPHSARTMVGRLLEASGRGLWSADPATLERLQQAYADLEDRLEGVVANG